MRKTISLFLAVLMMLVLLPAVRPDGAAVADTATYTKITSTADLTDGQYLVVVESKKIAFNGTTDAYHNQVGVTIADNAISGDFTANEITITSVTGGYTLKNSSGKYLHGKNDGNSLYFDNTAATNTISFTSGTAVIGYDAGTGGTTSQLVYNNTSGTNGERFRYYKTTTITGTQSSNYLIPSLYKKSTAAAPSETVIAPASATIPFGQVDTAITFKADTSSDINFTIYPYEPLKNENGDTLAWTVTGGGTIEAGKSFDITAHIDEAAWNAAKPGTYTGRIDWAESVTDDGDAVIVTAVVPETFQATLKETLADGDQVVIFYPAGNKVMSTTASAYGSKTQIDPLDATLIGDTLSCIEGTAIFNVEIADDQLTFKTDDGKYLYLDSSDVKFADAAGDYTLFTLEDTTSTTNSGFFIKSVNALYGTGTSAKAQYLEYYAEHFTVRSMNTSNPDIYTFRFYELKKAAVELPEAAEIPYDSASYEIEGHNATSEAVTLTGDATVTLTNGESTMTATVTFPESIAADADFAITVQIATAQWAAAVEGTYAGTLHWANGDESGEIALTTVVPAPKTATLKETIANGDKVVIFYPAGSKVMGLTTTVYNGNLEIDPVGATVASNTMTVPYGTAIFNVQITNGQVTFVTDNGKYLYLDSNEVKFVDEAGDYTLFTIENSTSTTYSGHFVKSVNATYNSKPSYLEYYANHFTVRTLNTSKPDIYTFQFFAINDDTPPVPSKEGAVVLFTNDVHCEIDASPKKYKADGTTVDQVGSWGYAGVAYVKKALEAEGESVFLVDAGDHVQGGPIGSLTHGESIIDIMNYVGYDVAIPGNHEFDYGMDQFLNTIVTNAEYPYVSANFMHYENDEPTTPVFDSYKTFEAADGTTIAFVGASTPESITKSTPTYFQDSEGNYIYGFCQDQTGAGVVSALQAAINEAKNHADFVIVIGHLGNDEQSSPWTSEELIPQLSGAIAYIDGHSHKEYTKTVKDKDGKDVLLAQTGTKLANIGKLTIDSLGNVTAELLPAPTEVQEDPDTKAYIEEVKTPFNALLATVVAYTDHLLTVNDPDTGARAVRSAETNLGDLCADAYLAFFADEGADIAFVNGGGVRKNINAGDIKFEDIINVHPFSNCAVLAEVKGQQILDALEMGARVCPEENGGFLQVAGLTYEIHTYLPANVVIGSDKMWQGTAGLDEYRVKNVKVLNKTTGEYEPLDLEKVYKLASHNYMLLDQGDGFAMFGQKNLLSILNSGVLDNQILINYIQSMEGDGEHDHVVTGYTDPKGEGRIKILDRAPSTGDTIILFTNDVHCGIEDGWGYAGVADLKKTLYTEGNEVLLVDAGDHIQGGPIGTLSEGEYIVDIMNYMGYDVAIPGNHEFDYGMDQFLYLVDKANYPYISSNFVDLRTTGGVLRSGVSFEVNDKKITFIGISTPETITKSTPTYFQDDEGNYIYGFCQDETGRGVYSIVQSTITAARAAGADYVILVGHMGIDEQSSPWMSTEVIANITGADAFIDGHSHSVIDGVKVKDKENHDVLHGQTGTKLANVGKLTIHANGELEMEILPASEKVQDDPDTKAYIDSIKAQYDDLLKEVVAYTENTLTVKDPDTGKRAVRSAETNLGDLCADAYRTLLGADIAFVNGGGVRADIAMGEVTFEDILTVHPFGNAAVLAEVTGQQILDALEMGSRVCPGEDGGFLQVSGLTYEINTGRTANVTVDTDKMWTGPAGIPYRVRNVKVLNKETGEYEPLDLEKTYTLASHNYMLKSQGDGMAMFGKDNITILQDEVMLDNKVLINYIQSMPGKDVTLPDGTVKHYDHVISDYANPKGEGRIKVYTLGGTIYGEDVNAGEVVELLNGKIAYRYDIKVRDIPAAREIVSLQAFIQFDNTALKFLEAKSELNGVTGINDTIPGKLLFGWASEGAGVTLADEQTVVSLYFEAVKPIPAGTKLDIKFTTDEHDNPSGLSYADGTNVVEADLVETEDGSITFGAIMLGDANCDGKITSADAAAALRSVVGLTALTPQGVLNADVNGDKKITAEDAAIILRYVVALIKKFPAA